MRSTVPVVLLALVAAPWLPSSRAQVPPPAGQVVVEKVATVGMQVPDTEDRLTGFGYGFGVGFLRSHPYYFLDGGTVVFWADAKANKRMALLSGLGLYSAKDGQLKTIGREGPKITSPNAEGIPETFDFSPPGVGEHGFDADIKAGGGLLYITIRFGLFAKKTRSVCAWDGDKLRPVLWRGESPAWLGAGEKIEAAEVVNINPDGSAMIVYSSVSGLYGIAMYSKGAGLRPLISTASPLPGMPGVTILNDTFEPLFAQQAFIPRKGTKRADFYKEQDRSWRWRLAPPELLGDSLFLVVEPSTGRPFLARIGGGKAERILEEGGTDPTDPGVVAEQIRSFKAITPDVVAVEISDGKSARRLLVSDKGKFSLIYQSAGAFGSVVGKQGYIDAQGVEDLQVLQVVSPEAKAFCALAEERFHKGFYEYATQVRCFDGTRMSNVTGSALIGMGSVMRAIPGLPGVLVINAQYTPTGRHATTQVSQWVVSGNAAGQDLRPAPEIYSNGDTKYTLGDVIGVDPAKKTAWLRLSDGVYKVHGVGE